MYEDLQSYIDMWVSTEKRLSVKGISEPTYIGDRGKVYLANLEYEILPGFVAIWTEEYVENHCFYRV